MTSSNCSRNLHLKKIAEIVDAQLAHAEKEQLSYRRLPRPAAPRPVAPPPGERARLAHQARAACPSSGRSSPSPSSASPASTAADPRLRRARLHRQGREHRLHRPHRRRQDRTRLRAAAQGPAERLPRPLRPRPGPLRRDVRLARRPLHAQARSTRSLRIDVLVIDELGYSTSSPSRPTSSSS